MPTAPTTTAAPSLRARVEAEADTLRERLSRVPAVAVVAEGSLLAPLADALSDAAQHPFGKTLDEPRGETLHAGTLAEGVPAALVQARSLAGGFSAQEAAWPVRVLAALGAEAFVLLGEATALAPHLRSEAAMLVADHLNLQGENPLVGPNEDDWGPRFPDMSAPYDAGWRAAVRGELSVPPAEGVYAAVPASTTPAERTMLHRLGADAVGSGLLPEVLAARHMDRSVLAAVQIESSDPQPSSDALPALMQVAAEQYRRGEAG